MELAFNARTVWHAEIGPAARILAERWPNTPNLGDLTRINWCALNFVDIVAAGYPCQPFSQSGKKQGINDDRHIWPFIADGIRILRPHYVVLENVSGHRRIGFDSVLGDLAAIGYDAQWTSIRAADVGAAHERERLFVLAVAQDVPDAARERRHQGAGLCREGSPPHGGYSLVTALAILASNGSITRKPSRSGQKSSAAPHPSLW
ncbi:DNA cytosine methyltransferase [Mycolicibacterium psychrotolerans]|uniref:DNA cytosine methyltransferase n=1 Tax=Mycolicibacterium psychrotolerans TaxID=216929 RepID=UPI003D663CF6